MSALADLRGFAPNRRAAPDFAPNLERLKSTRDAAGPLGLTLVPAEARGLDALEQAFATMMGDRAQALTVLSDGCAVELSSHSGRRSDRIEPLFAAVHESGMSPLLADTVAKVENRTNLKISRKLIFRLLCCRVALQRRYEGP